MSPQVFSATKPAVPWRGPVVAALLLIATMALAGLMVLQRGTLHLAPVPMEQGWTSGFELPLGSVQEGHAYYERWQMSQFAVPVGGGDGVRILLWERGIEPGVRPQDLADAVLMMSGVLSGQFVTESVPAPDGTEARIGALTGTETRSPDGRIIARAAVDRQDAFAVSVVAAEAIQTESGAYARFDATCRSMKRLSGVHSK